MKPCIYGPDTHAEGTVICVNGRGLKCVLGEWQETGQACDGEDGSIHRPFDPSGQDPNAGHPPVIEAKQ